MSDTFDNADYFDCRDGAELIHDTPEEAITSWIDDNYVEGESPIRCIRRLGPIEVMAFNREPIPAEWPRSMALHLVDRFVEDLEDEFGDPEGLHELTTEAGRGAVADGFEALIRQAISQVAPWTCREVAKRVYTVAEVEAVCREYEPEWFIGVPPEPVIGMDIVADTADGEEVAS